MKTIRPALLAKGFFTASCLFLALMSAAFAQTGSSVPVVTVWATQPVANAAQPGVFTVVRVAGSTNAALNVWYDINGTASNGVDYAAIPPHLVEIPAGAISNTVVITPSTNVPAGAVETVVLTLTNSPMMTPVNYQIGSPSSATVYIEGNGITNLPPIVEIISPTNGEQFIATQTILIEALPWDVDGYVTTVEFFAGTNIVGTFTCPPPSPPGSPIPQIVEIP